MKLKTGFISVILLWPVIFIQCSGNDNMSDNGTGRIALDITDAPSDDGNIQGTFVTVSKVKIDNQEVKGFTKQTIDISAFRNGETKLLFNETMDAKSYKSVTLVFDYDSDDSGNSPGCYVLTDDNHKHRLAASSENEGEVTLSKTIDVEKDSTTNLLIDFELRKAIVRDSVNQDNSQYKFVSSDEMGNAFRLVYEDSCGEVSGHVSQSVNITGDTYIFIYRKGEFDAPAETQGQGGSGVLFANAVSSTKVNQDGSYRLSFLNKGEYEIHPATFEKDENEKVMYKGMINATSTVSGLLLDNVTVAAGSQLQLNIDILGLI